MLVWVASFPRSGNTFLRIILHRLYGVRTSTVYDVDGVAARLGADLIGFTERPGELADLRAADEPHFIKTHRQRDADVDEQDHAICLVRDGRDALVSWARQTSEDDPNRYEAELRTKILRDTPVGTGSWGSNVPELAATARRASHRVALRGLDPRPVGRGPTGHHPAGAPFDGAARCFDPSLNQLRRHDDRFFRRGRTGSHHDELPASLHDLFWSRPDNQAAMALLGDGQPTT